MQEVRIVMHTSVQKRIFTILAAVAMTVVFGCGKAALDERVSAAPTNEIISIGSDPADGETGNAGSTASGESSGESYVSTTPDENALLLQSGDIRTISSATIDKTGDSADSLSSGGNAAVAVLSQSQLTLNDCSVSTRALGAPGLFVSGAGSVFYTGGTLATEGADSPCVLFSGGSISLTQATVTVQNSVAVRVLSGENELALNATTLEGETDIAEEAFLTLRLTNGASFTGSFGTVLPARASIYLDETSRLTLTQESYVSVFSNADITHQNIQSNGFSLYYDSNAPENEYLGAQAYQLPGGGFLMPII